MSPDPGPELDTRYVPGSAGAAWSEEEIRSTRARILQVSSTCDVWSVECHHLM